MSFLVLDTSTSFCSVALKTKNNIYSKTEYIPRQHNKYLLVMIDDIFKQAGINKKSLDFVACGVGPGSFVGVRLAASVAQAFAVSLDIPVIGFSSMYAIAKSTPVKTDKVAVILDAKMNDFYLGLYDFSKIESCENVYKLQEYSTELFNGFETVGEVISQINFEPNIKGFSLDVVNVLEFVEQEYHQQKQQNKLTHETFPVYLRGTAHWRKQ